MWGQDVRIVTLPENEEYHGSGNRDGGKTPLQRGHQGGDMSAKKEMKKCYVCHVELDLKRDKGKFVEAEGKAVCVKHEGVPRWYAEAMKAVELKPAAPAPASP